MINAAQEQWAIFQEDFDQTVEDQDMQIREMERETENQQGYIETIKDFMLDNFKNEDKLSGKFRELDRARDEIKEAQASMRRHMEEMDQ